MGITNAWGSKSDILGQRASAAYVLGRVNHTLRAFGRRRLLVAAAEEFDTGLAFSNRLTNFLGVAPYPKGTVIKPMNAHFHSDPRTSLLRRMLLADPKRCPDYIMGVSE